MTNLRKSPGMARGDHSRGSMYDIRVATPDERAWKFRSITVRRSIVRLWARESVRIAIVGNAQHGVTVEADRAEIARSLLAVKDRLQNGEKHPYFVHGLLKVICGKIMRWRIPVLHRSEVRALVLLATVPDMMTVPVPDNWVKGVAVKRKMPARAKRELDFSHAPSHQRKITLHGPTP